MEDLFHFAYDYFLALDAAPANTVANFPLFFIIRCGKYFGYNVSGNYSANTPYLNSEEGIFTTQPSGIGSGLHEEDIPILAAIILETDLKKVNAIQMNAAMRNRILDWYILFLQHHTQHLGSLRSLDILRVILH